ncbi:methyl-accepting chemotaxis protein [Gammaproteobacteria bacterium]
MYFLNSITIHQRLHILVGLLLAVIIAIGGSDLHTIVVLSDGIDELVDVDTVISSNSQELWAHILQLRRYEKDLFLNIGNDKKVADYLQKWKMEREEIDKHLTKLERVITQSEDRAIFHDMKQFLAQYTEGFGKISEAIIAGRLTSPQEANQAITQFKEPIHALEKAAINFSDNGQKQMHTDNDSLDNFTHQVYAKIILLSSLGILFGLAFGYVIARSIVRPLQRLVEATRRVAHGNLAFRIEEDSHDEVGLLATAMNEMLSNLVNMIRQILHSAETSCRVVDILENRAEATAEGTRDQAAHARQIVSAATQMTHTIADIAENALAASEISVEAMTIASQGKEVAVRAVDSINHLNTATQELANMVTQLNSRVGEIGNIVIVIKGIADQTNLLALNAAIEAARAGEQGRGFAVVAEEVRRLAERTISATTEVSQKIGAVQTEAEKTSLSMSESAKEVIRATDLIGEVGNALTHIVATVQQARDQSVHIASAVTQQSAAAVDVKDGITKTSTISDEIGTVAREVATQATNLGKIIEELRNSTQGFQLGG